MGLGVRYQSAVHYPEETHAITQMGGQRGAILFHTFAYPSKPSVEATFLSGYAHILPMAADECVVHPTSAKRVQSIDSLRKEAMPVHAVRKLESDMKYSATVDSTCAESGLGDDAHEVEFGVETPASPAFVSGDLNLQVKTCAAPQVQVPATASAFTAKETHQVGQGVNQCVLFPASAELVPIVVAVEVAPKVAKGMQSCCL